MKPLIYQMAGLHRFVVHDGLQCSLCLLVRPSMPWVVVLLALFFVFPATSAERLAGKSLKIGVRADAPPFSYRTGEGHADGYSVDLCKEVADVVVRQEKRYDDVQFVWIDPSNRFSKLASREIDLLCESTTVTLQRMRQVDFSVHTFVSGASFLYRADKGKVRFDDLHGQAIGVTPDTTTEALVRQKLPDADVHAVSSAHDGVRMVAEGKLAAYFGDREVLLQINQTRRKAKPAVRLNVSERYFSFEPYALGVSPDPPGTSCQQRRELLFLVNRTLTQLIRDGGIREIFQRHFPGQVKSTILDQMLQFQALPEGKPLKEICSP